MVHVPRLVQYWYTLDCALHTTEHRAPTRYMNKNMQRSERCMLIVEQLQTANRTKHKRLVHYPLIQHTNIVLFKVTKLLLLGTCFYYVLSK
jgi:hypothetical protein